MRGAAGGSGGGGGGRQHARGNTQQQTKNTAPPQHTPRALALAASHDVAGRCWTRDGRGACVGRAERCGEAALLVPKSASRAVTPTDDLGATVGQASDGTVGCINYVFSDDLGRFSTQLPDSRLLRDTECVSSEKDQNGEGLTLYSRTLIFEKLCHRSRPCEAGPRRGSRPAKPKCAVPAARLMLHLHVKDAYEEDTLFPLHHAPMLMPNGPTRRLLQLNMVFVVGVPDPTALCESTYGAPSHSAKCTEKRRSKCVISSMRCHHRSHGVPQARGGPQRSLHAYVAKVPVAGLTWPRQAKKEGS